MTAMDRLKLIALDGDDLAVISACVQDAVFKTSDARYLKAESLFTVEMNRFVWEKEGARAPFERRRAVLGFKQVEGVRARGVSLDKGDDVHSILAVRFEPDDGGPEGSIELVLSGGGAIRLEARCIEVQLADVAGSWETRFKPRHPAGR